VFQCLLIESLSGDLLLALSYFSGVLLASRPLCCVLVFSSVFIRLFFFPGVGWSICPGVYAGLSQGWLEEYRMKLAAHLFGLSNVFQAGLEPVFGCSGSLLVFSV
jgi:hypothetical protein